MIKHLLKELERTSYTRGRALLEESFMDQVHQVGVENQLKTNHLRVLESHVVHCDDGQLQSSLMKEKSEELKDDILGDIYHGTL